MNSLVGPTLHGRETTNAATTMMAASVASTVDAAGSSSASDSSSMASLSTMTLSPPTSRNRGRESPSDLDSEPLLLPPPSASSAARLGSSRPWLLRIQRCFSRVTQTRLVASLVAIFSFSGGVTWIVKGLCVCMGMMLMGGVGSFTLHQMMSPQIDSLLRQRNEMQQEMEELRAQVANWTRIATSRLEMIHLLEKELEKQVVEAAAPPGDGAANRGAPKKNHHFGDHALQANFWSTLICAAILGSLILAVVALRIYQIARAETQRTQKSRASSDFDTLPMEIEGDVESGLGPVATTTNLTPKLYKRAPGNAPTDRLVHV